MMKTMIAAAITAAFAFPAFAQTKADTQTDSKLPSAQERAENRDKLNEKLPTAEERAQNREKVSRGASNASLTAKVKTALASDVGMKTMTNIDVDSAEGVVTLKGKVDSADAKKKAEAIAKKVDGVKRVKNELKVEAKKSS
jgi:hyperosmotically inducible protein